jgi:hypothetical protein
MNIVWAFLDGKTNASLPSGLRTPYRRSIQPIPKHQTQHRRDGDDPNGFDRCQSEHQRPDDDERGVPRRERRLRRQLKPVTTISPQDAITMPLHAPWVPAFR